MRIHTQRKVELSFDVTCTFTHAKPLYHESGGHRISALKGPRCLCNTIVRCLGWNQPKKCWLRQFRNPERQSESDRSQRLRLMRLPLDLYVAWYNDIVVGEMLSRREHKKLLVPDQTIIRALNCSPVCTASENPSCLASRTALVVTHLCGTEDPIPHQILRARK